MERHGLSLPARQRHSENRRQRTGGRARQGVLGAIVALAFCSWIVVVQQETPELDASIARDSLVVLDDMLAAPSGEHR
jgi:hypothetical protein